MLCRWNTRHRECHQRRELPGGEFGGSDDQLDVLTFTRLSRPDGAAMEHNGTVYIIQASNNGVVKLVAA